MIGDGSSNIPNDNKVQPSKLDEQEKFERLKDWIIKDWNSSSEWRRKAEEWYAFEAGDQWEQSVKDRLKLQRRPYMTFNRVSSTVNAICGMEVNNRLETRYIPRTTDDTPITDMMTEAGRWVRDECGAEDEESNIFRDLNICGMGWAETRMDYEIDADGLIWEERVDSLEMGWDRNAIKNNLADARRLFRLKEMSLDAARAMFPDADDSELNADWLKQTPRDGEIVDREQARWYENGLETSKPTKCTIVEIQWYETIQVRVVVDPATQKSQEVDSATFKTLTDRATQLGIPLQSAKRSKRVYYRAFLGAKILDWGDSPCTEDFTWKCATAYRNRQKRYWYGVVEQMMDPQRWANAFMSSTLYTMMTSGKGILAERDAFDNPQKAEEDWAQADKIIYMKPGALSGGNAHVMPKPQSQVHPQINQLMQMSLDAIREVPGVNVEILGQANRDQPASLEYQRRQSVMAILAPLFDGLRRFRKGQGKLTLYFIRTYIPNGRMIRITGQQNAQYVPLLQQPDTVEYDVIVDDAPSSPNQKEQTWAFLQGLLPMITQSVQMSLPMWGEILKASPLPDATVNNFLGVAQQEAQQPQPPSPDMIRAQTEQQKTASDAQQSQVEAQIKQMELQLKAVELQLRGKELDTNTQMQLVQMHHDRQTQLADNQSADNQAFASSMGPSMPQVMQAMLQQQQQTQQMIAALVASLQQSSQVQVQATQELASALLAPKEIYTDPETGMPKGVVTVRNIQ